MIKFDLSDTENAIKEIQMFTPNIIIGGPPCQDFSHAGKRIESKRVELTESYAEIVAGIKPDCFIMENVDRIKNNYTYSKAREIFKQAGYGLTETVLDASLCGTPQKRKRFICFGMLKKEDGFELDIFTRAVSQKSL